MATKYWYLVTVGKKNPAYYLLQASTACEANKRLSPLDQPTIACRVNWLTMKKLTGCMIPPYANDSDFAVGVVGFANSGDVVCFLGS